MQAQNRSANLSVWIGALANVPEEEALRIRTMVKDIVGKPEYRDDVVDFVRKNGGVEYAQRRLDEYISEAVHALDAFEDSYEKQCLVELAHFTSLRNK